MRKESIYSELGYTGFLTDNSEVVARYPDYAEIIKIGADKIYFSGNHPAILFVEVDSFTDVELKRIATIQHKAWNYRKVILLFALSSTEIRIYNCYEKPLYINSLDDPSSKLNPAQLFDYNTQNKDADALSILLEIFSRIGVDNGLLWTEQLEIRKKINLQNRIDAYLVKCLFDTAKALEKNGLGREIIHGLLMRSLFILFLEDKGAANEAGLYERIKPGSSSYFDILEDKEATYQLFDEVQLHFNGNVSPVLKNEKDAVTEQHLKFIQRCFIDGDISGNSTLFDDWRIFNFEIIQIEVLSEIYENFLGEFKHERGQFYTPHNLVELILSDKLAVNDSNFNLKILDPACGSGIFLVESYRRLIKRWKKAHNESRIAFEDLRSLLVDNIFGIEIDQTAIKVAAFSLYIALVDELDPKTLWIETNYQLPYLIFDPDDSSIEHQGSNLWRRDTIGEVDTETFPKVDLIVGNPPFGTKKLPSAITTYCTKHKFANEYVLPFLHKSAQFSNNGDIALIFNSKVLTNTQKPYQNFRKWLFNDNHVEKIYNLSIFRKVPKHFGGQLFTSAVGPVSIVYFNPLKPENISETIGYWAPKTYVKSSLVDGVVIDPTDIKNLPRIECQNPNSKIWKIAFWGNFQGFRLLQRLQRSTLKNYFDKNKNWKSGRGLNADSQNPDFIPESMIITESIERYCTDEKTSTKPNTKYYRKNDEDLFNPPFILFKEGQHQTEIACSLFYGKAYCTTGAFPINNIDNDIDDKKYLVSYLNSDLAKFILFLTASSWGIERERVLLNELMELPSPFPISNVESRNKIVDAFDKIVLLRKQPLQDNIEIQSLEELIFEEFKKQFSLTARDIMLIEDTMRFNLGLFKDGQNSVGFHRTTVAENQAYSEMLCQDINIFLGSSKTKVSATVFDLKASDPLNLIIIRFYSDGEKTDVQLNDVSALRTQLRELDKYTIQQKVHSIYVQKHFKYYDKDSIHIIKPNQKRFWSRAQAMEDASALIGEILNMATK
ncbi:HsdM family class I SAM-dependent methyltransferase [Pedobacter cryoconitis]|uniref:site-specific DNA-methyltransferase (adenine-specific) n=1 Tax=Pedobacter cryoconitis TaxID=188932 RepID=A0A327SW45_9SPHI|nr:N-6 DNA methylase [Pedobacter cryoconitis]RAJ31723.1 type I restriction-modification system DNA methylase subunit [Pedobacter cryoconitis]